MSMCQAHQVLKTCEAALGQLLTKAAEAGDYADVQTLASLATQVADMAAATDISTPPPPVAHAHKPSKSIRQSASGKQYPRFIRHRDQLIKIGRSKTNKKEYQHKVAKGVIDLLVAALVMQGGHGRLFQSSDIMPLRDPADNTEVPLYQIYVILAWLDQLGLVKQVSKQSRSITNPEALSQAVEDAWNKLEV